MKLSSSLLGTWRKGKPQLQVDRLNDRITKTHKSMADKEEIARNARQKQSQAEAEAGVALRQCQDVGKSLKAKIEEKEARGRLTIIQQFACPEHYQRRKIHPKKKGPKIKEFIWTSFSEQFPLGS